LARVEAYVRDLVIIQPDGRLRMRMTDSTSQGIMGAVMTYRRDYSTVHAPVLAIYARTFFDVDHGDTAQRSRTRAWEEKYMAPFRAASIERVKRELPGIEIVNVPGTHMEFIFDSRDQIVSAMRKFLTTAVGS
jgi:hypothetical protein